MRISGVEPVEELSQTLIEPGPARANSRTRGSAVAGELRVDQSPGDEWRNDQHEQRHRNQRQCRVGVTREQIDAEPADDADLCDRRRARRKHFALVSEEHPVVHRSRTKAVRLLYQFIKSEVKRLRVR